MTTPTLSLEWMQKISCNFASWANKPKRIGDWIAATNGHILVAVKSAIEMEVVPEKAGFGIARLLDIEPKFGPIGGELLRSFASPSPTCTACKGTLLIECPNCHGNGDTQRTCDHCDEWHDCKCDCTNGKAECSCERLPLYGLLFGSTVNCKLLTDAVQNLGFDEFRWVKGGSPESLDTPIVLGGDDWRIVIMPMRPGCEDTVVKTDVRVLAGVAA